MMKHYIDSIEHLFFISGKKNHQVCIIVLSILNKCWKIIHCFWNVNSFYKQVGLLIGDVKMYLMSHWLVIINIRVSSCTCELRTDLIFLWIKVSSVIQTISSSHQRENVQFGDKDVYFTSFLTSLLNRSK
jgi:hypothetical protein